MAKFKKSDMLEIEGGDEPEGFKIVEEGAWSVDMKYQHSHTVFSFQDKFYRLTSTRSGSPFTDYTYESEWWLDEVECPEVEKAEKVTTYWRTVANG